jgi:hypothetical protein
MTDEGRWIQARSRGIGPDGAYQLRLRRVGSSVQAQHPPFDRAYPAFLFFWGIVAITVMSWSDRIAVLPGLVAVGLGVLLLRSALRVWTVIDADGWHGRHGAVARECIDEIVLFRGSDRRSDFVRTTDGDRFGIAETLPAPFTGHARARAESIDLLCHMQHDAAHDLGWEPIPVRVDLGPGHASASFVHPCDRCAAEA